MSKIIEWFKETTGFTGSSDVLIVLLIIVGALLVIASIVAFVISIWLAVQYIRYNRKKNSIGKTGEEVARTILDDNGLQNIRVSKNGSILFGNSYSHYFKKVRLRRLTWKKDSVTSLAMAAQKSSLAVLDKESDKDMKFKIILTPFIYFGPLAFIPLLLLGIVIDVLCKNTLFPCTIAFTALGLLFYVISFIMSILVLKTEKKAQQKALTILKEKNLATDEEIADCKKLFHLYNIEYINDMIVALLELIYRVLYLIAACQSSSSFSTKD